MIQDLLTTGTQTLWLVHLLLAFLIMPHSFPTDSASVCFSRVRLCATLQIVTCQTPLSMGFSRQEYWSGLLCPPPGDLPDLGIEPTSLIYPALAGVFFTTSATWETLESLANEIPWNYPEKDNITSFLYLHLVYFIVLPFLPPTLPPCPPSLFTFFLPSITNQGLWIL